MSSERRQMFHYTENSKFRTHALSTKKHNPVERLNAETKNFLLTAPVDELHRVLGDFYATSVMYGGVVQVSTVTAMFEGEQSSSVQADVSASYGGIIGSA